MAVDDYCANRTIAVGGDPWLVALFAAPGDRPLLHALGALRADLGHLVAHRSEPAVVAARAGWWQQELSMLGLQAGQHPATRALAPRAGADPALRTALMEWTLHLNDELGGASLLEPTRWARHLERAGRLHEAIARLVGAPPESAALLGTTLAEIERLAGAGERIAQSRPVGALGTAPMLTAPSDEACRHVAARAAALEAELAARAAPLERHAPLAIAAALGRRRARALVARPARAWRSEPARSLGAVFTAWRAAARSR